MNKPRPKDLRQKFLKAILSLNNLQEAEKFFSDILSPAEVKELSHRIFAAQLLSQKIPYAQIEKLTGMSSTTIARTQKWLKQGSGGMKLAVERLLDQETPLSSEPDSHQKPKSDIDEKLSQS